MAHKWLRIPGSAGVLILFVIAQSSAQEVPLSSLPVRMTKPVPDAVIYRIFLHHLVSFERAAQKEEAAGKSGSPFRNHISKKFGLTATNQTSLAQLALAFDLDEQHLRVQKGETVKKFRQTFFPNGKLPANQSLPALPPKLVQLRESLDLMSLHYRDQIRSIVGPDKFKSLDEALRSHFRHDYNTPSNHDENQGGAR